MISTTRRIPVLYLDLDGTVRNEIDQLVYPEALDKMREYQRAGFAIALLTNQGGIATGDVTLDEVTRGIIQTHKACGGIFDAICVCRHSPDVEDPEIANCLCRKPKIGMVIQAQQMIERKFNCICPPHLALFVGDRAEDEQCAAAAGIDFQWARDWRNQPVWIPEDKKPYERIDSE